MVMWSVGGNGAANRTGCQVSNPLIKRNPPKIYKLSSCWSIFPQKGLMKTHRGGLVDQTLSIQLQSFTKVYGLCRIQREKSAAIRGHARAWSGEWQNPYVSLELQSDRLIFVCFFWLVVTFTSLKFMFTGGFYRKERESCPKTYPPFSWTQFLETLPKN